MAREIAAEAFPTDFGVLRADWAAPPNVHAFTTLRNGPGISPPPFDRFNLGLRCGDDPANALENRRILRRDYGLPGEPRWLNQVHGAEVSRVNETESVTGADAGASTADASVASDLGVVLAILTADCLPVLFCNADGTEVAAAHAGWRGLAGGVLEATIRAMRSPASELMAWMGPAAGPQAYEIGEEVRDAFVRAQIGDAAAFAATRPGHWNVDLYALARRRLHDAGVSRIFGGGLCTISDPVRFYSYRRDQRTGRMASLIWMQPRTVPGNAAT